MPKGLYQRKKGGNWYYDVTDARGERRRVSTGTTDQTKAAEVRDRAKAAAWDIRVGKMPEYLWEDAVNRWLDERGHKRSIKSDAELLVWWTKRLGGMHLSAITRELVQWHADKKAKESSGARANRYVAVVRAILNLAAREWGWLKNAPVFKTYPETKRRVRDLTREQLAALMNDPLLPEHQRDMFLFALATGLRQGNVKGLRWDWLDLKRGVGFIPAGEFKTDKDHGFPLNADAMAILNRWKGRHPEYVFVYNGKPLIHVNTKTFRDALKRAGIRDFRWHDSRHVWASALARAGISTHALMELAGWDSIEMARRYAHLNVDHLKGLAAKIEGMTDGVCVTSTAHNDPSFVAPAA